MIQNTEQHCFSSRHVVLIYQGDFTSTVLSRHRPAGLRLQLCALVRFRAERQLQARALTHTKLVKGCVLSKQ